MSERRYLWVISIPLTRWLWRELAAELAQRHGLEPVLIVASEEERSFYANLHGQDWDGHIVVRSDPYATVLSDESAQEPLKALQQRAVAYERRHGITLQRAMVLADRHLGRAFMVGGQGYPRSAMALRANHERNLRACMASIDFWEELAGRFPPVLAISHSGGGGVMEKPLSLLCRERSIPFRTLAPARFGALYYWGWDEFNESPELEQTVAAAPEPSSEEIAAAQARVSPTGMSTNKLLWQRLMRKLGWRTIAYQIAYSTAQRPWWWLKGYRKARVGARLGERIRNLINARLNLNYLNRHALRDLTQLDERRIVYFTLHKEPEASTFVYAPHASNQYALLLELALSLPADAQLVVKEHIWALHDRTPDLYDKLRQIPNVVLAHPLANSLDIVRRAAMVCVISGSAGYEAAALGKPVVHFGDHAPLRVLPHVHFLNPGTDMARIPAILDSADDANARARREADGARYFLAAERFCMDLGDMDMAWRSAAPEPQELDRLIRHLLVGLPDGWAAPHISPLIDSNVAP